MLATTCWNPMATKDIVGNQIARILPLMLSAPYDSQTASATSQLHPIPDTKASTKVASSL
ncbi:hypothetical protein D3C87_2021030 [compost metagenome]